MRELGRLFKLEHTAADGRDMPPVLLVGRNGRITTCMLCANSSIDEVIKMAFLQRISRAIDTIVIITDGYTVRQAAREGNETFSRRLRGDVSLEDLFKQGDPNVAECITVFTGTDYRVPNDETKVEVYSSPYIFHSQENIEWLSDHDEISKEKPEIGGRIPDSVRKIFRHTAKQLGDETVVMNRAMLTKHGIQVIEDLDWAIDGGDPAELVRTVKEKAIAQLKAKMIAAKTEAPTAGYSAAPPVKYRPDINPSAN